MCCGDVIFWNQGQPFKIMGVPENKGHLALAALARTDFTLNNKRGRRQQCDFWSLECGNYAQKHH